MSMRPSRKTNEVSRRDFIKTSAVTGVAVALAGKNVIFAAPVKRKFRVGLIGCGGRGTEAIGNIIEAGKFLDVDIEVVGLADWFKTQIDKVAEKYSVPESKCFVGADAYRKLLDTDVDVVLVATPPNFRPVHFEAAINADKHVFIEKPVAVDPPGVRRVIEVGELAKKKGLAVLAGTQRRHQAKYRANQYAVERGAVGDIKGGCVWWVGGRLWRKRRNEGESDADYMVRNWLNFTEMSGDHIVEQHVHNLDVANWFIGHPPIRALGFGGRARRETGNQYDFFSVQYDYASDLYIHSMCRQVKGCYVRVSEHFTGTKGSVWAGGALTAGKKVKKIPNFPEHEGPYVQEHIDMLDSIIKDKPINDARNVAESTLTGIMGRISAYTGEMVRWSEVAEKQDSPWYNLTLTPTAEDFEKGEVTAPPDDVVPVPGKD